MIKKILLFLKSHKLIVVIFLGLVGYGSFFLYQKTINSDSEGVQYITSTVELGTLITSVSGSGQVSSVQQIDVSSKVSGDVVAVNVKKGDIIKEGDVIAQLNTVDAANSIRDSRGSLETALLSLEEMLKPTDELTLLKAENNLKTLKNNLEKLKIDQVTEYNNTIKVKQTAEESIVNSYEDAFNNISDVFLDLPAVMAGLDVVLFSTEIAESENTVSNNQDNMSVLVNSFLSNHYDDRDDLEDLINSAEDSYEEARVLYNHDFDNYKTANRNSSQSVIDALLISTIDTLKVVSDSIKLQTHVLDDWTDYRTQHDLKIFSKVNTYQSDLNSYTGIINSHISKLLSTQRTLEDAADTIVEAEQDIRDMKREQPLAIESAEDAILEQELSLKDLQSGTDDIDIRSQQLTIEQRRSSLAKAQEEYAKYIIKAPFDGVVAEIDLQAGDSISSNTTLATLITTQQLVVISLNEVDIVKVETGQKANIQFDAIDDVTVTGQVVEVDTIGSVTQGVVSYDVTIAFDIQDDRIRPGMSASVDVITDVRPSVLVVPNSAIKIQGNTTTYIEILENNQPRTQIVETGLSNDISTEIVSGLSEGDKIITQTVSAVPTTNSQPTQTNSLIPTGGRGFGGGR